MYAVNNIDYKINELKTKKIETSNTCVSYTNCMFPEIDLDDVVYIFDDFILNEEDIFLFETYDNKNFISRCKILSSRIKLIFSNECCNNLTFDKNDIFVVGKVKKV